MNYCTKCSSYYQVAGTCNCFAPVVYTALPNQIPTTLPTQPYRVIVNAVGNNELLRSITAAGPVLPLTYLKAPLI